MWLPKIQKYAKSKGMEVPTDMEGFKANGILQDAYFKHYAGTHLYNNAKIFILKERIL